MYLNTYHRFQCNKCAAYNWINIGDISDMTEFDPNGYECWNCREPECCDPNGSIEDFSEADFDIGERFEEVRVNK